MHMKLVSTQAPHFMAFMTFFTFIPFTFMPFMTFFTFIPFMVVFFTFFPFGVFLFLEQLYDLLAVLDLLLGMERRYEALPCRSASLCLFASHKSRSLCLFSRISLITGKHLLCQVGIDAFHTLSQRSLDTSGVQAILVGVC